MAKRPEDTPAAGLFSAALLNGATVPRLRRALFLPAFLAEDAEKRAHAFGDAFDRAHEILRKWADLESKGALARKETALDADFLREVFGEALGHAPPTEGTQTHQLERQFTVPGVGLADGALGTFSAAATETPQAVIELKAADVNLDSDRFNGRTPVQQCWDYLNALPACPWGIASNFVSLRLYHRDHGSRAFEHFTLQELKSRQRFAQFYYVFGPGGLLPTRMDPTPRAVKLLQRTGQRQREVGDELYDAYSQQRLHLIAHLRARHGRTLDESISIAQKILDRIIFVAFCEDRGLLPARIIDRVWRNVPPLARVTNPRWRNFIDLFHAVDKGHATLDIEAGYDGGLFAHDPAVDDLDLDDEWTDFFRGVASYDFRDEVNVDVLGHLFEKSITELEKLRAGGLSGEGEDEAAAGPAMPKSAERKRFGIYYTPPEFTAFLVEQAVGGVVARRLDDIARAHALTADTLATAELGDTLSRCYRDCLAALRAVKVCDPACGSGAFLIRAYDFFEERYADIVDGLARCGDREADRLADRIPDIILSDNLFGMDLSPQAVEITQLALWLRSARRGRTLADLSRNIVCGNSLVDDPAVHPRAARWADVFPDVFGRESAGFDCVIGNPPWERLKLQEREFFALAEPKIAAAVSAARRRQLIQQLEKSNPELHERYVAAGAAAEHVLDYARRSGRYPLTGKGDINTYALFAELARSIVAPHGRVGLLVPSGIASDKTTGGFFNALMDSQALIVLYDFENKRGFFPDVHRSFKFSTLVFGGSEAKTDAADFAFFIRRMSDLAERQRHIRLSAKDMALVNPNTHTCPIFRSRRDAELTKAIYRRVPVLIDRNRRKGGNPWGVRFFTMFHQTNDAELFRTAEELAGEGLKLVGNTWRRGKRVFLPLYEAKMVQAYDHRAAGVLVEKGNWVRQGQTEPTSLVSHQNPEFVVQPRWWVDQERVREALQDAEQPAYLCYKDVTSPTNERTMIAAFIPPAGVVNSAPLVLCDNAVGVRRQCCLLANLNSFMLDFVSRQKVGNIHLNFFIVEQLPILSPDAYGERCPWKSSHTIERWVSDRVLKLTCTADDMLPLAEAAGFKGAPHKWKTDERAALLAELDAAYFLLYGIGREDAEYILSTFTGTRRRDTAEVGSFRTAELILAAYDSLAGAAG